MDKNDLIIKNSARVILISIIIYVMVIGKSFLIPFSWSLLIALSSVNAIEWVRKKTRLPLGVVIFSFLTMIFVFIFLIGYLFYFELNHIFKDLPSLLEKISNRLHDLSDTLAGIGIPIPDQIDEQYIKDWVQNHKDYIMKIVSAFGFNIWNVILVMFYLFFLLYYKDLLPKFFLAHVKDENRLEFLTRQLKKSLALTQSYISGLLLITIVSAVMNFLVFIIFGLEYAVFFAAFLAILNLIPFVGNPIGLVVIMLFSLITQDGMTSLYIFIALFIMNFLQDNVVRPLLLGDKLEMNSFSVFVVIIIGGMIWGVSGMILFIPLVGILKIFLEGNEGTRNFAIFFSELEKNKPKKKKKAVLSDDPQFG